MKLFRRKRTVFDEIFAGSPNLAWFMRDDAWNVLMDASERHVKVMRPVIFYSAILAPAIATLVVILVRRHAGSQPIACASAALLFMAVTLYVSVRSYREHKARIAWLKRGRSTDPYVKRLAE